MLCALPFRLATLLFLHHPVAQVSLISAFRFKAFFQLPMACIVAIRHTLPARSARSVRLQGNYAVDDRCAFTQNAVSINFLLAYDLDNG